MTAPPRPARRITACTAAETDPSDSRVTPEAEAGGRSIHVTPGPVLVTAENPR